MAQGGQKLGKAKKSVGANKRKTVKTAKRKRKGSSSVEKNREIIETTKAINKKNERLIASKASNAGTRFFLNEISKKGGDLNKRNDAARKKKEEGSKICKRLAKQLDSLKK